MSQGLNGIHVYRLEKFWNFLFKFQPQVYSTSYLRPLSTEFQPYINLVTQRDIFVCQTLAQLRLKITCTICTQQLYCCPMYSEFNCQLLLSCSSVPVPRRGFSPAVPDVVSPCPMLGADDWKDPSGHWNVKVNWYTNW